MLLKPQNDILDKKYNESWILNHSSMCYLITRVVNLRVYFEECDQLQENDMINFFKRAYSLYWLIACECNFLQTIF